MSSEMSEQELERRSTTSEEYSSGASSIADAQNDGDTYSITHESDSGHREKARGYHRILLMYFDIFATVLKIHTQYTMEGNTELREMLEESTARAFVDELLKILGASDMLLSYGMFFSGKWKKVNVADGVDLLFGLENKVLIASGYSPENASVHSEQHRRTYRMALYRQYRSECRNDHPSSTEIPCFSKDTAILPSKAAPSLPGLLEQIFWQFLLQHEIFTCAVRDFIRRQRVSKLRTITISIDLLHNKLNGIFGTDLQMHQYAGIPAGAVSKSMIYEANKSGILPVKEQDSDVATLSDSAKAERAHVRYSVAQPTLPDPCCFDWTKTMKFGAPVSEEKSAHAKAVALVMAWAIELVAVPRIEPEELKETMSMASFFKLVNRDQLAWL